VLTASPAHAQVHTFTDPSGDAPKAIDLVGGKVSFSRSALDATVRLRDLAHQPFTEVVVRTVSPEQGGTTNDVVLRFNGKGASHVEYWTFTEMEFRTRCSGLAVTADYRRNVVHVHLPTRCLGFEHDGAAFNRRWVRFRTLRHTAAQYAAGYPYAGATARDVTARAMVRKG
jgi:hypothetical protein